MAEVETQENENGTTKLNQNKFVCQVCRKPSLNLCSKCQEVFYCSVEHQNLDWPIHKLSCLNSTKALQGRGILDKQSKLG